MRPIADRLRYKLVCQRLSSLVLVSSLTLLGACSSHTGSLDVAINGSLQRRGKPVVGAVRAQSPSGTTVASTSTDTRGHFELIVPSGNTYTISGTSTAHMTCGPKTLDIGKLKDVAPHDPTPPLTAVVLECASR